MDADLYDEFGNYIGPDLESDEESEEEDEEREEQPEGYVSLIKPCLNCNRIQLYRISLGSNQRSPNVTPEVS